MKKSKPIVRRATIEDLKSFWPDKPIPSGKYWLGEIDGEIVAVSGYAWTDNKWMLFCDQREPSRAYPMHFARAGKRVMADWAATGRKFLWAYEDKNEPTAVRWLESLGFKRQDKAWWRLDRQEV